MKIKQTILGLLVVAAGVLVFLANIDANGVRDLLARWWPLGLIVAGAYMLWVNMRNYVWSSIVILIGVFALLKTLEIADVNIGAIILPTILVGIGLNVIVAANSSRRKADSADEDRIVAVLGGSSSRNNSSNYTGGSVTAFLGGADLDLRKAKIKDEAVIVVSIVMGGLELRVPEGVRIINRTQSILGGVEDKSNTEEAKNQPALVIEGMVLMGGIEIKH